MLFGFETVSIDSGNYGANFWNHWKAGESFSTAWLNASWDIYHNQSPTVVASGANATEASNILYNERFFSWSAVARNWYQWRRYYASSLAPRNAKLPAKLLVAELAASTFEQEHVDLISKTLGFQNPIVGLSKDGVFSAQAGEKIVSVNEKGHLNIKLAAINLKNKKKFNERDAIKLAEDHIKRYDLDQGQEIKFDMIRLGVPAGGHTKNLQQKEEEYITDTTIQFRQIINGVPTVNHDEGLVRVTIDNDGTVIGMHSSIKKVTGLSSFPISAPLDPKKDSNLEGQVINNRRDIEEAFKERTSHYKSARLQVGSEETEYDVANKYGRLVVQRVYEVTFEKDFRKLIEVSVAIFE